MRKPTARMPSVPWLVDTKKGFSEAYTQVPQLPTLHHPIDSQGVAFLNHAAEEIGGVLFETK